MKTKIHIHVGLLLLACGIINSNAMDRFVALDGGHVPPFTSWAEAATNIQAAIDAASAGDTVWVTNGVYSTGGKVMAGDLTNRVALDKALTVQSVNGPWFTIVRGLGATNGTSAVRCAWLTNGAVLNGFTLTAGATRTTGDMLALQNGGGVWCSSSNALVRNCLMISNSAAGSGGGGYQGTLLNSGIVGNRSITSGSGVSHANLVNCTVVSNYSVGATYNGRYTNSVIYGNQSGNYGGSYVFSYCCTQPVPSGAGNIGGPPQLAADNLHLSSSSPCRAAGTNLANGVDLDGQVWANPPSMGCDEWLPEPAISGAPRIQLTGNPVGFQLRSPCHGQEPFAYFWMKDGTPVEDNGHYSFSGTTNLIATGVTAADQGGYQMVASNAFGVVTSAVTQLRFHYVDAGGALPLPPYSSWQTAATTIQDAIDATGPDEIVLVTNGIYATGGKVMGGDLTNRIALAWPILVQSVNGAWKTVIQGAWDPATNGPLAVRCAWLTNGAVLNGFTLRGGATRAISASATPEMDGGGVWGMSTNATVSDCRIEMNSAAYFGGGAFRVTLNRCTLAGNRAVGSGTPGSGIANAGSGGGAYACRLNQCTLTGNQAVQSYGGGAYGGVLWNCALRNNSSSLSGGAVYSASLVNCTITANISGNYPGYGSAAYGASLTNCLVWGNLTRTTNTNTNHASCTFSYSDTYPLPAGVGNISVDPQLLEDGYHLSEPSPCRWAGTNVASGTDIDGQSWNNPPAIGCDEWQTPPVVGAQPGFQIAPNSRALNWKVVVAGQAPLSYFWLKDGVLVQDDAHFALSSTDSLKVMQFGPEHAGSYQVIASNSVGTVTSQVAQVVIYCVDATSLKPSSPYSDWSSAAATIQDAIDFAAAGEIVLVTNGVYASGGKAVVGYLTNRVALDKALTVLSMNGPSVSIIQGVWDPVSTNGPLAIRCAWLTNAAVLRGFTLEGGATRSSGVGDTTYGGGVAATGSGALVSQCWILTNAAAAEGGGAYKVSLDRCRLLGNSANFGGGLSQSSVTNSLVRANSARLQGGGAYNSDLLNCTVAYNRGSGSGAGVYNQSLGSVRNCIIVDNNWPNDQNYFGTFSQPTYSCIQPSVSGTGNINASPAMLDDLHVAINSPCRGAGSPLYATGQDIDAETWANPPSMGCDEPIDSGITGPLSAAFSSDGYPAVVGRLYPVSVELFGRASWVFWSYGDGTFTTNNLASVRTWNSVGNYTVTFTAFNADYPDGFSTNLLVQVVPLIQPILTSGAWSNNTFNLSFPTQAGLSYRVERTTDLTPPVSWQTVTTLFKSPGGVLQATDPTATSATRFYRVRVL